MYLINNKNRGVNFLDSLFHQGRDRSAWDPKGLLSRGTFPHLLSNLTAARRFMATVGWRQSACFVDEKYLQEISLYIYAVLLMEPCEIQICRY